MGDEKHHSSLAKEKMVGALYEFSGNRYTNVGDLALKAIEQAIEACASREDLHFHTEPRTAHVKRREWLKRKFPELVKSFDTLWGLYADLGYNGLDGERAKKAIEEMERVLSVLQEKAGIRFK